QAGVVCDHKSAPDGRLDVTQLNMQLIAAAGFGSHGRLLPGAITFSALDAVLRLSAVCNAALHRPSAYGVSTQAVRAGDLLHHLKPPRICACNKKAPEGALSCMLAHRAHGDQSTLAPEALTTGSYLLRSAAMKASNALP